MAIPDKFLSVLHLLSPYADFWFTKANAPPMFNSVQELALKQSGLVHEGPTLIDSNYSFTLHH